ncbi:hypothetical protein [Streptomyces sp. NPDC003077]|uniref:hypothetical protein n=1 Tax=Streptomyces sp. NPDC003077 TaxID=3154443 RepID=UPI0033ADA8D8
MPESEGSRSARLAVSVALIGATATVIAALISTCGHGAGAGGQAGNGDRTAVDPSSRPDSTPPSTSLSPGTPAGWQKTFSGSVLIPSDGRGVDIDADTPRTVPLYTREDIYAADLVQPDGGVKFFDGAGVAALPDGAPSGPVACRQRLDGGGGPQATVRRNGRFCARSPNEAVLAATVRDISLDRGGVTVELVLWRKR